MSERLAITFTPRASRDIAEAKRWWDANRTKAPKALEEELRATLDLIATVPGIGPIAHNVPLPGVRRIHLERVNYFLYYRPRLDLNQIEVVALWHARRGAGPRL